MERMEVIEHLKAIMENTKTSALLSDIAQITALMAEEAKSDNNNEASLDILLVSIKCAEAATLALKGGF